MSEKRKMQENIYQEVIGKLTETITLLARSLGKAPVMPGANVASLGSTIAGERFKDNGNGTITDNKTGKVWTKDGSENEMNFADAEKYCKDLSEKTGEQWRLPTVEELLTLVDYTKSEPAINPVFNCKKSWYWTSTIFAGDSGGAWVVGFSYGSTGWDLRSYYYFVRPVRQY